MACCAADVFCYVLIVCSSLQASQEKLNPVTRVCRCLEVNSFFCSKITVLSLLWSQNTVNTSMFDHLWSKHHSPMRGRSGGFCCWVTGLLSWVMSRTVDRWTILLTFLRNASARTGSGSMRRRWIDGISSWRDWPCVTEPQGKHGKTLQISWFVMVYQCLSMSMIFLLEYWQSWGTCRIFG